MASANELLKKALAAAYDQAIAYVDQLESMPVCANAALETLRQQLTKSLNESGLPPEQVVGELARDVRGGLHAISVGRFFAWVNGGSVPASVGADWLTSIWDQNAGMYTVGPAAAVVEEIAGEWLKKLLGLPAGVSFAFVTGTQMAHVTCLAAARHAL